MAWLQVHQTLKDHRKLFDAADALDIAPPYMMGLLISFWLWALDNAPTGTLEGITPRMIARAAQYDGDAETLVKTLINAGWLDEGEDGTLEIHDWYEYAGKLADQRLAEKERSKRRRSTTAATGGQPAVDRKTTGGQPAVDQKTTGGRPAVDQEMTGGRPENDRRSTGGRVEKSREDKSIDEYTPPTPSEEDGASSRRSLIDDRFSEFWDAYPKKVGKQYALKAWRRIKPDAALHAKIIQAITAQRQSDQWRRENGRYIPNPSTWLNGGYWDNGKVEEVPSNANKPPGPEGQEADSFIIGFVPADEGG